MSNTLFSICIPNFNYARYLKLTCESVLAQEFTDYEVVIADNNSTDHSREVIEEFAKENQFVRYTINPVNVGFSGNLERVTALAKGRAFILLSSDDLMNQGALLYYKKLIDTVSNRKWVIGSSVNKVDSDGKVFERSKPDPEFWRPGDIHAELSSKMGATIYEVKAGEMLRRCLSSMSNPYYFLTVCYPVELFEKVGGYGGGRMYNPDKWFNWKLFSEAESVYLIDEPLFSYRWHQQNQNALETSFGHLKFLVDQYRNAIEVTDAMVKASGMSGSEIEQAFIKRDIYRHGIGEFLKGRWVKSFRIFLFGFSTFPGKMLMNFYFLPYLALLCTTPVGSFVVSKFMRLKR